MDHQRRSIGEPGPDLRVAALAPSATATLQGIDRSELLVGATNHCDVSNTEYIGGWLSPDREKLDALDPDLLLTADALQTDLRDDLRERGFAVHHVDATTLPEVLDSFESLGRAVGCPEAGARFAREARARLEDVKSAIAGRDRPVVYCEEWSNPPMAAGNWVPEAVEAAGGRCPFVEPGERSREISATEVEDAGPEHVVPHICGRGDRVNPTVVADRGWDLPAIETGEAHVIDDSLLNQPSPNLIDGIEEIARILHPEVVIDY